MACRGEIFISPQLHMQLEYLAVYGYAAMAAFRQLSTHIVPPPSNVREARLNTHGQKFDPES